MSEVGISTYSLGSLVSYSFRKQSDGVYNSFVTGHCTIDSLTCVLKVQPSVIRKHIGFWISQGILKELSSDHFSVIQGHKLDNKCTIESEPIVMCSGRSLLVCTSEATPCRLLYTQTASCNPKMYICCIPYEVLSDRISYTCVYTIWLYETVVHAPQCNYTLLFFTLCWMYI